MPDRAAQITALVSAGLTPQDAEDYLDKRSGWAMVRLRPRYHRLAATVARETGRSIGEVIGEAVEEYVRRRGE